MSVESAKAFVERMKTDEDFAKKVATCKDSEARKEFVLSVGFDFTMDELSECTGKELTDQDLDALVGGNGCSYAFIFIGWLATY